MHRRQVLAALPSIALAGCLSSLDDPPFSSSDERTPPPGMEVIEFTHPEYIRAGRSTTLGAVLKNTADDRRSGTVTLALSPTGSEWRALVDQAVGATWSDN